MSNQAHVLHRAIAEMAACLVEVADDYAHMCDEEDPESDGARLLRRVRKAVADFHAALGVRGQADPQATVTDGVTYTRGSRASGTGLQGYLDISYDELVEKLGDPDPSPDEYKVDAQWVLVFEDGQMATIYNYKTGRMYNGPTAPAVEAIRDWHVGGAGPTILARVSLLVGRQCEAYKNA